MKKVLLSACMMACALFGYSQNGVEGIIVEDYYTYDAASVADAFAPAPELGSKTYRIYVDLAPGFRLNAAFGNAIHNSHISTTTTFYNHAAGGSGLASGQNAFFHGSSNAALDSWLSMGAAGPGAPSGPFLTGLTKAEDVDGSIFSGQTVLQGTTNPINTVDGMTISSEAVAGSVQQFPNIFANPTSTESELLITNGSWFVTGGAAGPTATNRVLIAQVTTTGELSFELSLQVGGPNGPERYVPSNPVAALSETVIPALIFPPLPAGCTDPLACNFNATVTMDDGSCLVPDVCNTCNVDSTALVLNDADNNGTCDLFDCIVPSLPYVQNFDGFTTCPTTSCTATCALEECWINDAADETEWIADANGTPLGFGPRVDNTTGLGSGQYLFIGGGEDFNCFGSTGRLLSPLFDLTSLTNANVSFWYHMNAQPGREANVGNLFVDVSTDFGATWLQVDSIRDAIDLWQERQLDLSAYLGDTVQIRFRGITGSNPFASEIAIDDFSVFSRSNDDAGVASIDLTSPVATGSPVAVPVTITNFGLNTLTTATIDWSVNGVAQTPFAFAGSVAPGASASVTVGNFTFGSGLATVAASTSLPNGNVDSEASNNSAEELFCSPLAGVYTLGTGGDFTSFEQLADILNSCGVSASVVVNVDAGMYVNQSLILNNVAGLSSTSTLTIDGASLATISNDANTIIALNGTDWTTIQNMTIVSDAPNVDNGIACIQLLDAATGNTVDNCVITMNNTSFAGILGGATTSTRQTASSSNMTTISNNTVSGGANGICLLGIFRGPKDNSNKVLNNTVSGTDGDAIVLGEQFTLEVIGNHVSGQIDGHGINVLAPNLFVIANNTVVNAPDKGLDVRDANFPLVDSVINLPGVSQIYNNMVSSIGDHALDIDDADAIDVWHNTLYNTASSNDGAFNVNDITNVDIRNNIAASVTSPGFVSSDVIDNTNNTLDYNLYFSETVNMASENRVNFADVASWQAASPSLNANSVSSNPRFVGGGASDLHIFAVSVALNSGDNTVPVTVDIDGDVRPQGSAVDMGADEYTCTTFIDLNTDGICDSVQVFGCIDVLACNFNQFADTDDGSCMIETVGCDTCVNGMLQILDCDLDGICDLDDPFPCDAPYEIARERASESCNVDTLCIGLTSNNILENVIGFDIVYTYDATKVTPTGLLTYSSDLIEPAYADYHMNINFNTGVINIANFLNASAPLGTSFNGNGELFCIEFVKAAGHASIDTVEYSATLRESYANGVEPSDVQEGMSVSHQDTIFTGSLEFWLDNSPLVYDTANTTDYLITNIFGTDSACGSESTAAVQPNLSGEFQYMIYNGEKISIQRDIADTTQVMPSINTGDVLNVVYTTTLDTIALGFRPNAFQMIAMDVNLDGFVSAGDASQIFQRSVVTTPEYAQAFNYDRAGVSNGELSKDWLFIDEQTTLSDAAYTISATYPLDDGTGYSKDNVPSVPFCLPIPVTGFDFSTADCPVIGDEDYIGILLGDIDGAFATAGTGGASGGLGLALKTASDNAINLDTRNGIINGNYLDIPVSVTASAGTRGLSFSTELTEGLVFESILEQSGEAIANVTAFDGRLNFATYNLASFVDGQTVATLRFKVESAVDMDNLFTPVYGFFEGIPTTVNDGNGETPTDIGEFNDLTVVSVMPNPAKDELNVVVSEDANVQLLDVLGKEILIEERVVAGRSTKLNVSHLSDGVYFLKVYTNDNTTVTRVVINN